MLPADAQPAVACALLMVGLLGVATMRLSDRLRPARTPTCSPRDVLNVMLAGLQSGVTLQSTGVVDCPLDEDRRRRSGFVSSRGVVR